MPEAPAAAVVVVVVVKCLLALELIETALREGGHRVLTTTKAEEVIELAQLVRIDVLVGERGDSLSALEEEVRLVQPHVGVVCVCEREDLESAGGRVGIARPVSLQELDAVVREAAWH